MLLQSGYATVKRENAPVGTGVSSALCSTRAANRGGWIAKVAACVHNRRIGRACFWKAGQVRLFGRRPLRICASAQADFSFILLIFGEFLKIFRGILLTIRGKCCMIGKQLKRPLEIRTISSVGRAPDS